MGGTSIYIGGQGPSTGLCLARSRSWADPRPAPWNSVMSKQFTCNPSMNSTHNFLRKHKGTSILLFGALSNTMNHRSIQWSLHGWYIHQSMHILLLVTGGTMLSLGLRNLENNSYLEMFRSVTPSLVRPVLQNSLILVLQSIMPVICDCISSIDAIIVSRELANDRHAGSLVPLSCLLRSFKDCKP